MKKNKLHRKIIGVLETVGLAVTIAIGTIPLEIGAPGLLISFGEKVSLFDLFWVPLAIHIIVNTVKMLLLTHLLHGIWPKGILHRLLKIATKVKSFEYLYKRSLKAVHSKHFLIANSLLFLLGLLPLPTTQVGILVTATTKYRLGIIPIMLGSAVKFLLAALGSYHGWIWLRGFDFL